MKKKIGANNIITFIMGICIFFLLPKSMDKRTRIAIALLILFIVVVLKVLFDVQQV